jgi:cell division protein FtsA
VGDIILEQLASSHSVLTEDEKDLGVCMIDVGGGTTDIAIFTDGAIRHTAIIPIAGDQVTNDIAIALRTPANHAEEIKIKHGTALPSMTNSEDSIEVPGVARRPSRQLSKKALSTVISARYEELFALVKAEIRRSGFEDMIGSGIVLTGGAALIEGVSELAEAVFQMPVRIGLPQNVRGLKDVLQNPMYSTGVGLLLYGLQHRNENKGEIIMNDGVKGLWSRMRNWFQGNF